MSIGTQEQQAVLSLIKYFSDCWNIIDVGSNKLNWSEILINHRDGSTEAGKYTIHSIEPNDKLRSYQQVRYDYNDNIKYYPYAAYHTSGLELDFYHWENKNNGLSSLLNNHRWEDEVGEFRKIKKVKTITLTDIFVEKEIDIIKIDVEGVEWHVLQGSKELLQSKRVKFIQIEYSEHYQLTGSTFKQIIDFVNQFGYNAWQWDGQYFQKLSSETFVEDYRLENFIITYIEIGRYHYTQLWNSEFIKNTKNLPKFTTVLEIGCFEGLTTNYICDHLLEKDGRVICVDPLTDEYLPGHKDNAMFVGQYERFIKNTKNQPVELIRKTSKEAFAKELLPYAFDFVFIDGDHTQVMVYFDGCYAYLHCKIGGYILFDDYGQSEETRKGIDRFIEEHLKWNMIEVVIKEYQVLIKKIA